MATIEINGADIYYETYGKDQPGKAPIVLIHGSTVTGQRDWGLVAPLLGREYRVIVPDCRGHGRSSNPRRSYSFKEMADDTRALIQALGYERAHIIGHSNGGNVALVTLLEHPQVVQTAVLQAANAYVSPDLVEIEPMKFDPQRVEREAPDWRDEMIALHGAWHGMEYWRELLQLTVREIISEPNYTAEDLAKVQRPTLVIQGANDRVNAPSRHAQFIAENIPYTELWIPEGIGHNVHEELLLEWVERVLDFLKRRGDEANEALYRLKQARFRDERETIFEVRAEMVDETAELEGTGAIRFARDEGIHRGVRLTGQVLTEAERQAAVECLERGGVGQVEAEGVRVLLHSQTPWALARRGVADLRREPRSLSERVSQVLYGEAVRILQEGEEYAWVRMEKDGYMGWVHRKALQPGSEEEVQAYQRSLNAVVVAERAVIYADGLDAKAEAAESREPISKLPFGVLVCVVEQDEAWSALQTPEGGRVWVRSSDLLPLTQRPKPDAEGIAYTLGLLRRFVGIPYLWGGRSTFGYDCSGLSQAFYGFMGVAIPRDADQQCRQGMPVEGEPQAGDLLFFGRAGVEKVDLRYNNVTHVAISLGGAEFIHASGGSVGITINSLEPHSPIYNAYLQENLLAVRRFR